jgi:hypothetical protein
MVFIEGGITVLFYFYFKSYQTFQLRDSIATTDLSFYAQVQDQDPLDSSFLCWSCDLDGFQNKL